MLAAEPSSPSVNIRSHTTNEYKSRFHLEAAFFMPFLHLSSPRESRGLQPRNFPQQSGLYLLGAGTIMLETDGVNAFRGKQTMPLKPSRYAVIYAAICTTACFVFFSVSPATAKPSSTTVAKRIDQALTQDVFDKDTELAPRTDDATFLRRVTLDLIGDIPPPETVIAFLLDPSGNKREQLVQTLLADPHYGQNWARYWHDVVFFRAQEDRARIAAGNAMVADLAEQLNAGTSWDQIATDFLTARGDVKKNGHAAIIMAQDGRTEETTAEMSRIFLGIQIQCAQCHDHPYDRWKREQFHELASFFPRIAVRPVRDMTKRSFEVYSNDRYRKRRRKNVNNDRRPKAEHRMPDLDNPEQPGQVMQPKFFLTSDSLSPGTRDADRRERLAQWLTANEWFAIALVNRVWSELVGEGFYATIDDLGPDREANAPVAIKLLAKKFSDSSYDLKWLLATICKTEAYQRQARPRRKSNGTPFVANVPQRLRSDQLFNALLTALAIDETKDGSSGKDERNQRRRNLPRDKFADVFGYDPSDSREDIAATIPQSLALMNSQQVNRYIKPKKNNLLYHLLQEIDDNESLVVELYLRCLSREPHDEELATALAYCKKIPKRKEVFEDLLWVLINSAEFQYRK